MLKMFKRNNNVMKFMQNVDKDLANAYRTNDLSNLYKEFSAQAIDRTRKDMIACPKDVKGNNKKYGIEKYANRDYEIIAENGNVTVIKRTVTWDKLAVGIGLKCAVADTFTEIFTIVKNNNNFMVANIQAA